MELAKKKVFVGMSGGVDSSVAALLLNEQGYEVVGVFMKSWDGLPTSEGMKFREQCRWREDRRDALRVAAKLRIPFLTYDFTREYRERVIEYFFREHEIGRTPNPDIRCNREIKFKLFLERALVAGAGFVATGHYVRKSEIRNQQSETRYALLVAADQDKDQSYFLYTLGQRELGRVLFPIGDYTKTEVREIARQAGLPTADKPDSQGICFVGEVPVADFLRARSPLQSGPVVTASGRRVGEHDGLPFYTIGQRRGLGLSARRPYYVAEKKASLNTLVVGEGPTDSSLYRAAVSAAEVSWVNEAPTVGQRLAGRIRYRQPLQWLTVVGAEAASGWLFQFDEPQRAVTSGQSIVIYDGERVVGGGIIHSGIA